VDRANAAMIELCQHHGLATEPFDRVLIDEVGVQQLQGPHGGRAFVDRLIDRAHTASADGSTAHCQSFAQPFQSDDTGCRCRVKTRNAKLEQGRLCYKYRVCVPILSLCALSARTNRR
jgi:hypothetical protein